MRAAQITAVLTLTLAALAAAPAYARTPPKVQVGGCLSGYANYPTISAALRNVPSGSEIQICPGTYAEQLTIAQTVSLVGVNTGNSSQAHLVAPAGGLVTNAMYLGTPDPVDAQIVVQAGVTGFKISGLTIDGSNSGINGCSPDLVGILVQDASGTITDNAVVNTNLGGQLEGCQTGLAIYVESDANGSSIVTVSDNDVENFQKNGITGNDAGTVLTVTGNTVLGLGDNPANAQNSIQIAFGATGSVTSNVVGNDVYTGGGYSATGILIYASAGVTVKKNMINDTQGAVYVEGDENGDADKPSITGNHITTTQTYDGIDVCGLSNATITGNIVTGSDESAIHVDSECGGPSTATVNNNKVNFACAGILVGPGSGLNSMTGDAYTNVATNVLTGSDVCPAGGDARIGGKTRHRLKAVPFKAVRH
jgi:hypothetical protein